MKKILLCVLLACFQYLGVQAQQPFPTTSDNPLWNTMEDYFWDPGLTQNVWTMSADTQMCGETYHIAEAAFANGWISGTYKAFVRNQGSQVWFRKDNTCAGSEELMYDYGMSVGDTFRLNTYLHGAPFNTDTTDYALDSITMELHFGISRRVFHLGILDGSGYRNLTWIEGIGAVNHPFYPLLYQGTEEDLFMFCYTEDSIQLYQNPITSGQCVVSVSTPEPASRHLTIFPNPSSQGWAIENPSKQRVESIQVFDQSGRLRYTNDGPKSDRPFVPAMEASGIYFVHLVSGEKSWWSKLVQQ